MSELNGHNPADMVAGDDPDEELTGDPAIFIRGEFIGGDPNHNRVREVSVTIPTKVGDTWTDYALAIEVAVREIGNLGYWPGNRPPKISIGNI